MKRIITLATTLALAFLSTIAMAKDDVGHTLVDLWKQYYAAERDDRPKDQVQILEKIKKEAKEKKLAWDYYDACEKYVRSRSAINWKEAEKLEEDCAREIEVFGEPVAVFSFSYRHARRGKDELFRYALQNKKKLEASHNPEFYALSEHEPLRSALENDYDYVLWECIRDQYGWNTARRECEAEAHEWFKGRYPMEAFVDYELKMDQDEFLKKYEGKAAALMVRQDILRQRIQKLSEDKVNDESQYRSVLEDCRQFSRDARKFSGPEKAIAETCRIPESIMESLEQKDAGFTIREGELKVYFRNVTSARIKITKDRQTIYDQEVRNPACRFYVRDTAKVMLPAFNDGEYEVHCTASGIQEKVRYYGKNTLSASLRKDARGIALYVAESVSGKPVSDVRVKVLDEKDNVVAEQPALHLDGYTYLPENIAGELSHDRRKTRYVLVEWTDGKGILHLSEKAAYYSYEYHDDVDEGRLNCRIFTDRSAFSPDETMHFKAIVYKGHYTFMTVGQGHRLTAKLFDAENKEISEVELSTNEFGSVAGEFKLERRRRNGIYRISIEDNGRRLASQSVRVDDFVLPTFDLTWNRDERDYHPGETVTVGGNIRSFSGHSIGAADISYEINGTDNFSGKITPATNGDFSISFDTGKEPEWQHYYITVKAVDATGETLEFSRSISVVREHKAEEPKEYYFKEITGDPGLIGLRAVAGQKTTWACVELFGAGNVPLEKKLVRFDPKGGKPAETTISFSYRKDYPDVVMLKVLYFQNNTVYSHTLTARRPDDSWKLPLRFTRFLDTTAPGARYTFSIRTEAGVEMAATIFDRSTESVMSNTWSPVMPNLIPEPSVHYSDFTASDFCEYNFWDNTYWGEPRPVFFDNGATKSHQVRIRGRAADMMFMEAPVMMKESVTLEESMAVEDSIVEETAEAEEVSEAGYIRENFANTIAWEPFLRSDEDGNISFSFNTADKLSTYYVQLFVHDKDMRNFVMRREMKVTLPVKIALVEPQFLYDGDRYVLRATLSNSTSDAISGTLVTSIMDGSDHQNSPVRQSSSRKVNVPAGGSIAVDMDYEVKDLSTLGIKMSFTPDDSSLGADGIFVAVPVFKAVQTITEAHSAVLLSGEDRDALIARLRSEFVNIPGAEAAIKEVSIRQMLQEAIPELIEPKSDNVVSQTEALFARYLLDKLRNGSASVDPDSPILAKIMDCRNADGGFAWFKGMDSSPILTVLVLERLAQMDLTELGEEAVHYLDRTYFSKDTVPYWRGWVSMEQYVHVRALYSHVDFSSKGADSRILKNFRKAVKTYLVPRKVRGLNGMILAKARRIKTLQAILYSEGGISLANDWGIVFGARSRMEKSLGKDIASLVQYAEKHRSGGYYFPNAVMPWRGLIESELYAHAMLCELLDEAGYDEIADGVRLWMMIQKETQDWGSDPAYIEALSSVLKGSEELLNTKVIALSGSFTKPFEDIKAAGNGFTIERSFYRDGKLLQDGDEIHVGDRITAKYSVWNEENRSFVRLSAPRCAGLRPVEQRSGYLWGCYRSVLADRTEFWFDVYPEEKTTRSEDFYATQEGVFQSPVVEIVCLYADHYRANDAGRPAMKISPAE